MGINGSYVMRTLPLKGGDIKWNLFWRTARILGRADVTAIL